MKPLKTFGLFIFIVITSKAIYGDNNKTIVGKSTIKTKSPFESQINEIESENIKIGRHIQKIENKIRKVEKSLESKSIETTITAISLVLDELSTKDFHSIKIQFDEEIVFQAKGAEELSYQGSKIEVYKGPLLTGRHTIKTTLETLDQKKYDSYESKFIVETSKEFRFNLENNETITRLSIYPQSSTEEKSPSVTYTIN